MSKVFRLLPLFLLVAILASCGSKKGPTGGPEDLEKPVVLTSLPAQFGQIDNQRIEINFSKALDKASVTQAVYIYPPVADKKISVDKSTLLIRLHEDLLPDTNYYVTLTTRLKDVRGNALAENQTLVFAHGALQNRRLSGEVSFEDPADGNLPFKLTLVSADSLLVLNQTGSGPSYAIESLNSADYILRGYIDKDGNGRYDFAREPYYEGSASLRQNARLDIAFAYADTVKPLLQTVVGKSPREIELTFSEALSEIGELKILAADGETELPILLSRLRGTKLTLLTAMQDKFAYTVEARSIKDLKGNATEIARAEFRSNQVLDNIPPSVSFTNPRNGTSVNTLEPLLEVHFTEIIPHASLKAALKATESGTPISFDILQSDSDIYKFKPRQALQNYRSYVLTLSATDISGNPLKEEYKLNFLPLLRTP
ncbi:MAG TPA: Ig-like domain-containing protein [Candidatus Syntrophosphaera sp.]|nr:Ig-like domain-containing protein [Candidatus Syntrophosphaera sp.]